MFSALQEPCLFVEVGLSFAPAKTKAGLPSHRIGNRHLHDRLVLVNLESLTGVEEATTVKTGLSFFMGIDCFTEYWFGLRVVSSLPDRCLGVHWSSLASVSSALSLFYLSSCLVLHSLDASIIVGLVVGCVVTGAAGYIDAPSIQNAPAIAFLWVCAFKVRVGTCLPNLVAVPL